MASHLQISPSKCQTWASARNAAMMSRGSQPAWQYNQYLAISIADREAWLTIVVGRAACHPAKADPSASKRLGNGLGRRRQTSRRFTPHSLIRLVRCDLIDQAANILNSPSSYSRTDLHRLREAARLHAFPPSRFADRYRPHRPYDCLQPNESDFGKRTMMWHIRLRPTSDESVLYCRRRGLADHG